MDSRSSRAVPAQIDERLLRDTAGHFATGVTVVTTLANDARPIGMVVNSFSCLSLAPPLVMWGIDKRSPSFGIFKNCKGFIVHIMGENSVEETMQFANPLKDKFKGIKWSKGIFDMPVLTHALAILECRKLETFPGGDHEIIIGQVERCDSREGSPLVFYRGRFAQIGAPL